MKKVFVLAMGMLVVLMPLGFAGSFSSGFTNICGRADSSNYQEAVGPKLARGLGNVVLSWTELFRQPRLSTNKLEGVGRGFAYMGGRVVLGALEAATAIVPGAKVPQLDPSCPTDLVNVGDQQTNQ